MDPNIAALDLYAKGWARGDMNTIYPVLDKSYTFAMSGMEEPVKLENLKQFFSQFRSDVATGGGPATDSDTFMRFTNIIRRQVREQCLGHGSSMCLSFHKLIVFYTDNLL